MGLEINLILEVRRNNSESWTGFTTQLLGIREAPYRDYSILEALALYRNEDEDHPLRHRGLPNDVSETTIQECCMVVFQNGGIQTIINAENNIKIKDGRTLITRNGIVYSYCQNGFCRNHTWFTYDEFSTSLERCETSKEGLNVFYKKLLLRVEKFKSDGFQIRFIGWVCN